MDVYERYVNTILHGYPHLIVNWVEIWAVRRPEIQLSEVGISLHSHQTVSRARYAGALHFKKSLEMR